MNDYRRILANLPPLPRTWTEHGTHDSNPPNTQAWRKHLAQLKRERDKANDVKPMKRVRRINEPNKRTA